MYTYCHGVFTVSCRINLFCNHDIQSIMKMSPYENIEKSMLNVQHSILELDMVRKLRLFLQYFLNVFGQSILFPILCCFVPWDCPLYLHRMGSRMLYQYPTPRYCEESPNNSSMSWSRIHSPTFSIFSIVSQSIYIMNSILNIIIVFPLYSAESIHLVIIMFVGGRWGLSDCDMPNLLLDLYI
jgi:hypothetical protein